VETSPEAAGQMNLVQTLVAANVALTGIGLFGLLMWLNRQIQALRGTLDAQKNTISAFTLTRSMFDPSEWRKRFEDYRKLVDLEKEAIQISAEQSAEEAVGASSGSSAAVVAMLLGDLLPLAMFFLLTLPPEDREKEIGELPQPLRAPLRKLLQQSTKRYPFLRDAVPVQLFWSEPRGLSDYPETAFPDR
jgi:hypothetical protein